MPKMDGFEVTRRNLQAYRDDREAENGLAAEILEQIMQRPGLSDPSLHYWISSAGSFSGDILAATVAINNRCYVMLADGTGHGLAAAISVLPLLPPFYDSAGAGVPPAGRLDAVKDAVNQHLGTQPAHDDLSLLLIDLPACTGSPGH